MSNPAAFTGSVPKSYHEYLVPLIFERYAEDMVGRLKEARPGRVLELACGTGVVTRRLVEAMPQSTIVATDLNPGMLDVAKGDRRVELMPPGSVEFQVVNACSLPYEDGSFDAIACQYGVMFFPDKVASMREARRVLKPGGVYVFNVWDSLEHNPVSRVAHETVAGLFPANPPDFLARAPYGWWDRDEIERVVRAGGFAEVTLETVGFDCVAPTAEHAARGLVEGTPLWPALTERGVTNPEPVRRAVARAIGERFGDAPCRSRMRAVVVTAR